MYTRNIRIHEIAEIAKISIPGKFVSTDRNWLFYVLHRRDASEFRISSLSLMTSKNMRQAGHDKKYFAMRWYADVDYFYLCQKASLYATMQICWSCSNRMVPIWNAYIIMNTDISYENFCDNLSHKCWKSMDFYWLIRTVRLSMGDTENNLMTLQYMMWSVDLDTLTWTTA